ncbi:MAG: magnesium/cobalt transporter CorA [Marinifilaceae bacterium]
MSKISKRLSSKIGLAPGTLIPIGLHQMDNIRIHHYWYDHQTTGTIHFDTSSYRELFPLSDKKTHWIHIVGMDVNLVKEIGDIFNIHSLVLEDILNSQLRPKYENHDEYCFLALKGFKFQEKTSGLVTFPVYLLMGANYVISIVDNEAPLFSLLSHRLKNPATKLRNKGSDYLFFAIADVVVDSYFNHLERGTDLMEEMEEQIDSYPSKEIVNQIQDYKKSILKMRRNIFPLKEAYSNILKEDSNLFKEENQKYFQDTHDHILFALDQVDYLKEYLNSLRDSYQSFLDNQLNQTIKVLTLIATLFIPLTFLAGIYGMNFEYIPELKWKYGYFGLLTLMFLLAILMIWFFRKKKWL